MDDNRSPHPQSGPHDLTMDAAAPARTDSESEANASSPPRCMHLVEGPAESTNCETRDLLRSRLRIASLILCGGSAAFMIWGGVRGLLGAQDQLWLLPLHLGVTAVLAVCAFSLCRRCNPSLGMLRVKEVLIFGLPACYFLASQAGEMTRCAADVHYLPNPAVPWLILMFTYALFIPNSWKRASIAIGAMALAPLLLIGVLVLTNQDCAVTIEQRGQYPVDLGLAMGVAFGACVAGVYSINALRQQALEARQLGQYRLGRRLGSGGMGEVFKAEHQLMKRPCAIKIIRPEKAGDPRILARFEREVRTTAKLSHWNNIDIYDYGRADDGTFYYVMEFLPGMNLQELVATHGPLPPERVVYLMRQTCEALAEAHGRGLIHRDIKPANIFAAERGGKYDVAKLLDFGLAKPLSGFAEMSAAAGGDLKLTVDGHITGSPLYMSPEQALGEQEPDERSDIYALGLVMYYLLTGRPPFEGENPLRLLAAHAHVDPRPLSDFREGIPEDLERLVMVCLAKLPADRYQSADELLAALQEIQLADEWDSRRAERWWRQQQDVPQAASTT